MKKYLSLFMFIFSLTGFSSQFLKIDWERQVEIMEFIKASPSVAPYFALADDIHNLKSRVDESDEYSSRFSTNLRVDCNDRPMSYGSDLAPGYCKLTFEQSYGWYADPFLVKRVIAYIKEDKIHQGDLLEANEKSYNDIKISEVTIETPLQTGLE